MGQNIHIFEKMLWALGHMLYYFQDKILFVLKNRKYIDLVEIFEVTFTGFSQILATSPF